MTDALTFADGVIDPETENVVVRLIVSVTPGPPVTDEFAPVALVKVIDVLLAVFLYVSPQTA